MDTIWIILLAVLLIIVALGVAIGLRRRRSQDYSSTLDREDRPADPQYARTTTAARFSDRTGSGAGGGV